MLVGVACGGRSALFIRRDEAGNDGHEAGGHAGTPFGGVRAGMGPAGDGGSAGFVMAAGIGGRSLGGSTAGSGVSSGVGGVGGLRENPHPCVPTSAAAATSVECEGGFLHHPSASDCGLSPRTDEAAGESSGGMSSAGASSAACASDLDCTDSARGYCIAETRYFKLEVHCLYACRTDADCTDTEVCACERSYVDVARQSPLALGICQPAACKTDAECGGELLCISPLEEECGPRHAGAFHCQTSNDECAGPGDCTNGARCSFTDGRFVCESQVLCRRGG